MPNQYVTVDYPSNFSATFGDPFANAATYLGVGAGKNITSFVQDQIDTAERLVTESEAAAYSTIAALGDVELIVPDNLIPQLPTLDFNFNYEFPDDLNEPPEIGDAIFGNIGSAPVFTGDTSITRPTIPTFNPSYTNINIPSVPVYVAPTDPGLAPEITAPIYPDSPIFVDPPIPVFSTIVIPDTPDITIPDFSVEYPEFTALPPDIGFDWTEPTYTEQIIQSAIAQIETFLAGGTGIREDVQEAYYNRASEREDRIALQAIQEVTDAYAARGFSIPPGLLQKRVEAITFERDLKKQGISRDVLIKTMEAEIENLRFAVQQGIQAEELYIRLFLAANERAFLALRSSIEYAIQLYNFQIDVFRAKQEEIRTRATVYETQVRAALIEIEIFKAQIDAELAKVQVDQSKVELYKARIESLKTYAELYETQVRAELGKLEASRIAIQAYGEEVNAYAAKVNAQKIRFDAYESQIRGELGKVQMTEAEARAYSAEVQGISTGVTAEARSIEAEVSAFGALTQAYLATVNAEAAKANIAIQNNQNKLAGYDSYTRRYVAGTSKNEALARIELAAWNSGLTNQIEYYRAQVAKYQVDTQTLAEQARIALGALDAEGTIVSTIIGGALAAMHVGATISGSGSISATGTLSDAYQTSKSISDSTNQSVASSEEVRLSVDYDGGSISPDPTQPPWGLTGGD